MLVLNKQTAIVRKGKCNKGFSTATEGGCELCLGDATSYKKVVLLILSIPCCHRIIDRMV